MGWCSGSEIAFEMIDAIEKYVEDEDVQFELVKALFKTLEWMDWDCQSDLAGDPLARKVLKEMHPDWDLSYD